MVALYMALVCKMRSKTLKNHFGYLFMVGQLQSSCFVR